MQIPLLRGRYLSPADSVGAERVVLIDSLMARTYFPHSDALGQTLTNPHWGKAGAVAARIVGVVGHVEQYGIDGSRGEKPQIYYSFYQLPDEGLPVFRDEVTFAVRTPVQLADMIPLIEKAVRKASADQPAYNFRAMHDLVSGSMARQRFSMILLVAFALLALVLAAVGIYGVISYSMAQRVREIGIRMALGAEKKDVLWMVVRQGLRLAVAGIAAGIIASMVLLKLLSSFMRLLYGVRATDPLTFTAVSVCLLAAALAACYLPVRRAAGLDPISALRHE